MLWGVGLVLQRSGEIVTVHVGWKARYRSSCQVEPWVKIHIRGEGPIEVDCGGIAKTIFAQMNDILVVLWLFSTTGVANPSQPVCS